MSLQSGIGKIKAVIMDVDGTLTDGCIGYGMGSTDEIKFFNVRDGHGIRMAIRAGLKVGFLSGRKSVANETRAKELQLSFIHEGCHNKLEGLKEVAAELGLDPSECMFIGDDLVDMPAMRYCGFAVAVQDAVAELDDVADMRTKLPGGHGAVREILEYLMKEQGLWKDAIARYYC